VTTRATAPALPRALAAPAPNGSPLAFTLALLGAALVHLFLILAVSFEMPKPSSQPLPEGALEILILKDSGTDSERPAPDAVLSQRSRPGESPEGNGVISTPDLDAPPEAVQEEVEAPADHEVEPEAPTMRAQIEPPSPDLESEPEPDTLVAETPPPPDPLEAPPSKTADAAQILNSRNQEIARLTASLEARTAAYASRLRRRSVSASTREFRYANYLAAWARKVERIGNLNYPQAAKEQHLHGNLILHVAVRKDGTVEAIRVVRSSGYDVLDQAAVNIVKLAAPYSPFPPDIAGETDVLDIVRTWQFMRGGRLGWEN